MTYGELGELHDLFMLDVWEELRPALRDAFASLPSDQVLVDIGAGTGVGTTVIAQETHCRIWAIEPDLVMRAALTHRVSADPHLADRVTIVAGGVPEALSLLPDNIAGVACAHVLGHLDASGRRGLLEWCCERLPVGSSLLLTVDRVREEPDDPSGSIPSAPETTERRWLGEYEYVATHLESGRPHRFLSRYEVRHRGRIVREQVFTGRWQPVTAELLEQETDDLPLGCEFGELPSVVLLRRQ